jgi:serine/threonine protein kinase
MVSGLPYVGQSIDIWSCGVVLFAMVCGYLPFEDGDTNKLYRKIVEGKFNIPDWISDDCAELISKILNIDPLARYTSKEIISHEWYTSNHEPVCNNGGLIIGKNKIPLEDAIVKMLLQYGVTQDEAEVALNANKHNQVTTIYYLLHKRYEKLGKMPAHFNILLETPREGSPEKRQDDYSESPVKQRRNNGDPVGRAERAPKQTRAERVEYTGSLSPDKKKRRLAPRDQGFESPPKMTKLTLKFGDSPTESNGAVEYRRKIERYTQTNYKYKKRDEKRSVDEKQKTRALLRNIEAFLNRGTSPSKTAKPATRRASSIEQIR